MNIKLSSNYSHLSNASQTKQSNESTPSSDAMTDAAFDFFAALLGQATVVPDATLGQAGGQLPQEQSTESELENEAQQMLEEASSAYRSRETPSTFIDNDLNVESNQYLVKSPTYANKLDAEQFQQTGSETLVQQDQDQSQPIDLKMVDDAQMMLRISKQADQRQGAQVKYEDNGSDQNIDSKAAQTIQSGGVKVVEQRHADKIQVDLSKAGSLHDGGLKNYLENMNSQTFDDLNQHDPANDLPAPNLEESNALSQTADAANMASSFANTASSINKSASGSEQNFFNTQVDSYRFTVEMPEDVVAGLKQAENAAYELKLKIYPPNLGEVTAKITVQNKQASLKIIAQSEHDSHVVMSNLEQLREQFEQHNINLANIDVSSSTSQEKGQKETGEMEGQDTLNSEAQISKKPSEKKSDANQLVDTYI